MYIYIYIYTVSFLNPCIHNCTDFIFMATYVILYKTYICSVLRSQSHTTVCRACLLVTDA
jgi:hypothetical protein